MVEGVSDVNQDARVDQMLAFVMELASGNLDARLELMSLTEPLDGVFEGLNMLAEELSASVQGLKRSEKSFRSLIERIPDAIFVHRDGKFAYVNTAALKLLGFENANELLNSSTDSVLHLDEFQKDSSRVPVLHEDSPNAIEREGRLLHRNGSPIDVELISFHVDFDGVPAILTIVRDVSARKKLIAKMMELDRMVAIGTLAAGVGHEINNPLAYLISNLDFAIERLASIKYRSGGDDPIDAYAQDALVEAREGAERVRRIVQELKTFSRSPDESSGNVDIEAALESAISMATNEIRHRSRLVREYSGRVTVDGNSSRLGQVFLNLLVNAAHAIPEGSARANQITVRTRIVQPNVYIEICDTGCGIEPEHVARLFDPFFTTKPIGQGMGLGLYMSKRIVHAHHGEIQVETEPGKGSVFRVILKVSQNAKDLIRRSTKTSASTQKRARVLIIDDEPNIGRSLARALSRDHDVTVLTDAHEALRRLTDGFYYDIVLCDLMMPDMTGVDLYTEVNKILPEMAQRMLFLTGGAFTPSIRDFAQRMAARCLTKPFNMEEIRRRVTDCRGYLGNPATNCA